MSVEERLKGKRKLKKPSFSPTKNPKSTTTNLAQVIADCGFYEFTRQLGYKAKKFGCEIIIASRWFPSSKTCSNCGHIQDMPLKERVYNCQNCRHSIDRDLNAAINLSRLAKA